MKNDLLLIKELFVEGKWHKAVIDLLLLLLLVYVVLGFATYAGYLQGQSNYMPFWHAPWQWLFNSLLGK